MGYQYVILEFVKKPVQLSLVSERWITFSEDTKKWQCFWPPTKLKDFQKLVKEHVVPDPSTWKIYDVRILKRCDDYHRSIAKYERAIHNQSSDSVVEAVTKVSNVENIEEVQVQQAMEVQEIDDNNSSSGGPADPIEALKKDVEDMKKQLKEVLDGQNRLMAIISDSQSGNDKISEQLEEPLQTIQEFESFEELLQSSREKRSALTKFIFQLGGKNCADMVKRAMRRIGTNGLWSQFSMKGKAHKQHKKLSLKKTAAYKCLLKALLKSRNTKELDIEVEVSLFLRQCPYQMGGDKYKRTSVQDEIDSLSSSEDDS